MSDEDARFLFPQPIDEPTARALLAEAYAKVRAGKIVRATTKRARREGFDPPSDVAYVAEPVIAPSEAGLGVDLGADILLYHEFSGWQRCLAIFEEEVIRALAARLERSVARWLRRHPADKA